MDGAPQWVSIARVSNLAEVGYFADLLAGEEIESLVHQRDDFDAVHERWQRTFVLQVPESDVSRAAAVIESEVSQADAGNENFDLDSQPFQQADSESNPQAATTAPWKPIVLLLLVGGLTYSVTHAPRIVPAAPRENPGAAALGQALSDFKAGLQGQKYEEAFLPAVAPGTIEHWMKNDHYPNDEAYLVAIADAMHEEYKAIVDAGFLLQIDDPDLPDGWQFMSKMTVPEYRKYAQLRVDALNHGLRDIPPDRVRFHTCWGSYHGPHKYDIALRDIVDIILKVNANTISIEAANPRHEHEWRVWEEVKLPAGKVLVPGVVGHATDIVEHPQAIADRLVRYAKIVGRENVMAGTDCGLGPRVGSAQICWAKFEAMAEGARLATRELWGR